MIAFERAWHCWKNRKQAKWVWDSGDTINRSGAWICSNCRQINHNIPEYPTVNPYEFRGSWFCPSCGRPMCDTASFKQYVEHQNYQVFAAPDR